MARPNDKNRGKGPGSKNAGGKPGHQGNAPGHVHGPGCKHDHEHDHGDQIEVPPGLAMLPEVPDSLAIDPFVLSLLDMVVFVTGTDEELLHQGAADEMLEIIVGRFANLAPDKAKFLVAEIERLREFGKNNGWDQDSVRFLKDISDLLTGKELQ